MNSGKLSMILAGCLAWSGSQGGVRFHAALNGAQVSPAPVNTTARGNVAFNFRANLSRLSFRLKLRKGTRFTSAQLHCAPTGVVGPVVADLLGSGAGGWNGSLAIGAALTAANLDQTANCAAAIGQPIITLADLAAAMRDGQIYVVVPSAAHPDGEIRGQIEPSTSITPPAIPFTPGPSVVATEPRTSLGVISTPTALVAPIVQRASLPTYFNPPCPSSLNPQCSPTSFNPPCPSTFGAPCSTNTNPALMPVATVFPFTTVTTVSTITVR
ncbi:CHRD domain-containing protein [Methylomagnum sp.]